ncbi:MAG: dienelactone hydrolase family protein, partial [Bacteroidia bacterium]|nr:dienelactone hydrolase family protein [Bacteroidia bacterium]
PEREAINKNLKIANNDERLGKWFTSDQLSSYDSLLYATRGQNWAYDPLPYLKKINVPMFYVLGGEDINMPTKEIEVFLDKFRDEENKNITIKVYPEASHYLYKWGLQDGPYEGWLYLDGYLELLTTWAKDQLR